MAILEILRPAIQCPICGGETEELPEGAFVEMGEWNGNSYKEEGSATAYRCLEPDCRKTFFVW